MKRLALVLVVLAACKKSKKEEAPPPPPAPGDAAAMTAPDAPTPDAAGAAAGTVPDAPPGALVASEAGVGPLTEKSAIDVKALKAAFPDHDVKKVSTPMDDGDLREEYVGISKGGQLLLKVIGDSTPNHIAIVSNDVWNPFGVSIGMTHADVAKLVGPLTCSNAGEHTDWKSDIAECGTEKIPRFTFEFEGDESAEDMIAKPDLLASAKLVALVWDAPGSGPPGTE